MLEQLGGVVDMIGRQANAIDEVALPEPVPANQRRSTLPAAGGQREHAAIIPTNQPPADRT